MSDGTEAARRMRRWLWRDHLRRRSPMFALALVFMALEGAAVGGLSWLVRPMFDGIRPGGEVSLVWWVALAVAGVFILRAFSGFAHRVILFRQAEGIAAEMQEAALAHVLKLDLAFYQKNPPGALIERIAGDATAVKTLWPPMVQALGRDSISLVALLTVAVLVDWRWTAMAVIGVPVVVGPLALLQRRVRDMARRARAQASILATRLDEGFHGVRTLQLTGTEAQEVRRYRHELKQFLGAQRRAQTAAAGIPALIDLVAALGFAGVMLYGGSQILAGEKTMGEFMSFFTAMALVFEPLRRLGGVSATWAQARASLERLRGLMEEVPGIRDPEEPLPLPPAPAGPRLELRDLRFAYGEAEVLAGLSFVAEAGKTTALVGPSGAGKTTVFHLLTRLADPQGGQILLEGTDIRRFALADLRRQFAVVAQEAALFDETIADNVRLGAPGTSEDDLARALADANAAGFVAALAQGVNTPAGPRGSALSGGQRQRVAIARAMLRDAPILLLDEATSALDSASEKAVTEALDRLAHGRTTLVIAHRLSTVLSADKIVVMNRGRVVDQGSHAELLERGGLYADLYRLQFRDEEKGA